MTYLPGTGEHSRVEYHRLAQSWRKPRWWKPLAGLLLAAVFWVLMFLTALVPFVMSGVGDPPLEDEPLDFYRETDLGLGLFMIALMLPAIMLGFRVMGCAPLGLLSSVAGRVRWAWMARCCVPALLAYSIAVGAAVLFGHTEAVEPEGYRFSWLLLLLALLLVPLQAAAEEYVFRGGMMQTVGAWLKHPAWAILLPVPLFMIGHEYDLPGQVSMLIFAVACGWITWKTGGLEAAVVLHVVNNLVVFGMGLAGLSDMNQTEVGWGMVIIWTLPVLLFVVWVNQLERVKGSSTGRT